MATRTHPRDPWRRTPVGELGDPLLPRWFVVTALLTIPVAIVALVAAFALAGPEEVPLAERRPPPAGGLVTAAGAMSVGESRPQPYEAACPTIAGIQVAGTDTERDVLERGLAVLCNIPVDDATADRLERFAAAGGVVRFAVFEATGVDSTADLEGTPPRVLVNAKFRTTNPAHVAPLVAHDVTFLDEDPASAEAALTARRVEHAVCERALAGQRPSRACDDAAELLAMPEPLAALRAAGFE